MPDPITLNLTHPVFESITLTLVPGTKNPGRVARQRLTTALRQLPLPRPVKGWQVRRVPGTPQLAYDLIPPAPTPPTDAPLLAVNEAWDLTYALETLPAVEDAEPSFIVIQDAEPISAPATETPPAATAAPRGFESCVDDQAPLTVDPRELDWSARLVDAPCAWQLEPPPTGKRKGEGIRVGHPDSGYLLHPELCDEAQGLSKRIVTQWERDFVDRDPGALNPGGHHGLSTASVIISSEITGRIVGIAPAAELTPLRVTKPHVFGIPAPILFGSGARALRDAIRFAVNEADCHVISISLGWFANESLHEAVREAEAQNVIVCAAAGNYTGIVIWPAAYPEALAVAGCNAQRRPWSGSARGAQVGISGPAENVWVPAFRTDGEPTQAMSSGTSFAVATVAGVAALWLAYHGRATLLERYQGQFTLTDVFRYILGSSSDPFAGGVGTNFGAGIVNARRVLKAPLPTLAQLQTALPAVPRAAAMPPSPLATIASVFPDIPIEELRTRLAIIMNVSDTELDAHLANVEDEVIFHLVTDPALRAQILGVVPGPVTRGADTVAPAAVPPIPAALAANPLSGRLRSRVG